MKQDIERELNVTAGRIKGERGLSTRKDEWFIEQSVFSHLTVVCLHRK